MPLHGAETDLARQTQLLGWHAEHALGGAEAALFSPDVSQASSRLSDVYNSNRLRLLDHAGDFGMRLRTAQLGRLGLATLSFGAEIEIEQAGDRPFVLVTTQMRGFSRVTTPVGQADGGCGFVVVDSAGQAVSKRFSGDSERCNVRVDQAALEAKCAALLEQPLQRPLRFSPFSASDAGVQRRWISLLQGLLAMPVRRRWRCPGLSSRTSKKPCCCTCCWRMNTRSAPLCASPAPVWRRAMSGGPKTTSAPMPVSR